METQKELTVSRVLRIIFVVVVVRSEIFIISRMREISFSSAICINIMSQDYQVPNTDLIIVNISILMDSFHCVGVCPHTSCLLSVIRGFRSALRTSVNFDCGFFHPHRFIGTAFCMERKFAFPMPLWWHFYSTMALFSKRFRLYSMLLCSTHATLDVLLRCISSFCAHSDIWLERRPDSTSWLLDF